VQARSSERAAYVEIETEERETSEAVNITAPNCISDIGRRGRCARDGLLRGSAIGHGQGQDYRRDNEKCGRTNGNNFTSASPEGKVSAASSNVR